MMQLKNLGDHDPFGGLRGGKYSLFEAGTRVPFITYWKGKIKPQVSDELVTQIDFLESFSSLIGSGINQKMVLICLMFFLETKEKEEQSLF